MNELILTILGSIGGTTVVLGGLFGWLGKRYLDSMLEAERSANKVNLALVQSNITKEIEQHKSGLKFNERFLENQFEASFKLYKIRNSIVPPKTNPEMDWYEACDEIAHNFEKIEPHLTKFLEDHYTTLPPDVYELVQKSEYLCSDGKLEVDSPEIPSHLNKKADTLFQNIDEACRGLKSFIDGQRKVVEPNPFELKPLGG